jgi:hypothetical protein
MIEMSIEIGHSEPSLGPGPAVGDGSIDMSITGQRLEVGIGVAAAIRPSIDRPLDHWPQAGSRRGVAAAVPPGFGRRIDRDPPV